MSADFKLPLNVRACIADTCHMTNEEAGAHFRLVFFACQSPWFGVPDDDSKLALMLRITPKRWARVKPIVMAFWHPSGGLWTHRCLEAPRSRKKRKPQPARGSSKPHSIVAPANVNHPKLKAVLPVPIAGASVGDR